MSKKNSGKSISNHLWFQSRIVIHWSGFFQKHFQKIPMGFFMVKTHGFFSVPIHRHGATPRHRTCRPLPVHRSWGCRRLIGWGMMSKKKALVGWWFFNGTYNLYGTYSWYSWFMAFIVDIVDLYGIYIWDYGIYMVSWCSPNHQYYLVGGLEHEFYDRPFSWEFHHPNWRTHIFQRGRYTTNQL